ncbi:MAG: hypothetical protein HUK28_04015 [Methanobrevibacter sp.]|nr:hypothetical protein [Methanobrevibacter sp.]
MSTANVDALKNNPKKALNAMTLSMMLVLLFPQIEHFITILWVQGLGTNVVAAIGFLSFFVILKSGIGRGVVSGVNTLLSNSIGEGDKKKANNYMINSILISLVVGIISTIIFIFALKPVLIMLGGGDVLQYSMEYAFIFLIIGTPIYLIDQGLIGILRAEGNAKSNSYSTIIACVFNMVFGPIFIYILNWGVKGAALSNMLSDVVLFVVLLYFLLVKESYFTFSFKNFKFEKSLFSRVLYLGLPGSTDYIVMAIITAILTYSVSFFGEYQAITVITSADKIIQLLTTPLIAFSTTLLPVIGVQMGLKNYKTIKDIFNYSIKKLIILSIILTIALLILNPLVVSLYSVFGLSSSLFSSMTFYLFIFSFTFPFSALISISMSMFQGLGKGFHGAMIPLIRHLISSTIAMYILGFVLNMGLFGIYLGILIGFIFTGVVSILWINNYIGNLIKNDKNETIN